MSLKVIKTLRRDFPKAFSERGAKPLPLKIGIINDLRNIYPQVRPKDLRRAVVAYVRTDEYLEATTDGAPRINLEGDQVGTVTRAHALWAAAELWDRREKRREKIADVMAKVA